MAKFIFLLVLMAFAPAVQAAQNTQDTNISDIERLIAPWRVDAPDGTRKLRVCISSWTPHVFCEPDKNESTYTGYQVALWREVSKRLPWLPEGSYFFDCMDWTAMIDDMVMPNGTCFAAPSGVDVIMEYYKKGVQFSWPTYRSGYKIMINRRDMVNGGNAWTAFAAFHWSVWVLLVGTGLLMGLVLSFTDQLSRCIHNAAKQAEKVYLERLRRQERQMMGKSTGGPGTTAMDPPDVMASPSPPSQPPTLLRTVRFKETDIETGLCQSASPPQPQQQPPGTITAQCSGTAGQASDVNSSTTPTQQPAPSSIGLRNLSFVPAGFATPFHDTDSCSSQISYTAPDLQHHHNKDAAVTAVPPGAADSSADCQKQQADVSLPSKGSTLKATKSLQAEFGLQKGQRRYTLRSVGDNAWATVGGFVNMAHPPSTRTLPGRLILFFYGLLVLIMIQLYTANTSANLTTQQIKSQINSKDDLKDKTVVTWQDFTDSLRTYGINAVGVPWETTEDEAAMLEFLRNGSADAMVQDKSFVDYTTSRDCGFYGLPNGFHVWDLAIGYSPRLNLTVVKAIDDAIMSGQGETSMFERLQLAYISIPNACSQQDDGSTSHITLDQVAGLWLMLALGIGVSYALLAACYLGRFSRRVRIMTSTALPVEGSDASASSYLRSRGSSSGSRLFSSPAPRRLPSGLQKMPVVPHAASLVDGASVHDSSASVPDEAAADVVWPARQQQAHDLAGRASAKDYLAAGGAQRVGDSTAAAALHSSRYSSVHATDAQHCSGPGDADGDEYGDASAWSDGDFSSDCGWNATSDGGDD